MPFWFLLGPSGAIWCLGAPRPRHQKAPPLTGPKKLNIARLGGACSLPGPAFKTGFLKYDHHGLPCLPKLAGGARRGATTGINKVGRRNWAFGNLAFWLFAAPLLLTPGDGPRVCKARYRNHAFKGHAAWLLAAPHQSTCEKGHRSVRKVGQAWAALAAQTGGRGATRRTDWDQQGTVQEFGILKSCHLVVSSTPAALLMVRGMAMASVKAIGCGHGHASVATRG